MSAPRMKKRAILYLYMILFDRPAFSHLSAKSKCVHKIMHDISDRPSLAEQCFFSSENSFKKTFEGIQIQCFLEILIL